MYSGGQLLEDFAGARARADMNMLLGRAPKRALRYLDGQLAEVDIELLVPGDRILVRQGEIVPVDGKVASGKALLDQSILTGRSVPVYRKAGDEVSAAHPVDTAFDIIASTRIAEHLFGHRASGAGRTRSEGAYGAAR
jgi:P-type E1-E2 ATPase